MTTYGVALVVHSYLRWPVIAVAGAVIVRGFVGWLQSREWVRLDERLHVALVALVDIQLALGIWLYFFLSPLPRAFLATPHAMKEPTLRFFGVEHAVTMALAVVVLHVGRVRSKRAATSRVRQRRVWTTALAALLLMMVSIPWPFLDIGRPLFRSGVASAPSASSDQPLASPRVCPASYAARCVACHGQSGRGDGLLAQSLRPPPRDFAAPSWGVGRTDSELRAIVKEGGAAHGLSAAMPAHSDLAETELDALVSCVRWLHEHAPANKASRP